MAYSNGYNLSTVLPALRGRLGWRTDASLNDANKGSSSGRYFDDGSFHAIVTVDNLRSAANPSNMDTFLAARQDACIAKALQSVFGETEFFEQTYLYNKDDIEQQQLIPNEGLAAGWRLRLVQREDMTYRINRLVLYFDGAAEFNVYLFKQGSSVPVKTQSVTTVANQKTEVALADWLLNYRESEYYYVVYFQSDLGAVRAIEEQSFLVDTCTLDAMPMQAKVISGLNFNKSISTGALPYGINLHISSFRDVSNNILNNPALFDELLGLTMAQMTAEEVVYSVSSNKNERILKDQLAGIGLQMDLNGVAPVSDSPKTEGLRKRIAAEASRVRESFYPRKKSQTINVGYKATAGWY